jgi:hypothetical protein
MNFHTQAVILRNPSSLGKKARSCHIVCKSRCEGENSCKPQALISLNYCAKEYLDLLPSFCELHASLLEKKNTTVLEISRVTCGVRLPSWSVLPGT